MKDIIREFFGFGGYARKAEGYMSWQHLAFVSTLVLAMTVLAVIVGLKNKNSDLSKKNRALIISAILMDSLEIFKMVLVCVRGKDPMGWLYDLPLFLCSIQLITIPLAAFSKGRLKDVALDFVFIFGILGALAGTYCAGQNYSCYPVLSFDNVVSGITHTIAGFSSLYIVISGMESMKKRNIPFCFIIVSAFCVAAYAVNVAIDYNYMFLMRGDGTPYDILYNLVGGHKVAYPFLVAALFYIYITAFYLIYRAVNKKKNNR